MKALLCLFGVHRWSVYYDCFHCSLVFPYQETRVRICRRCGQFNGWVCAHTLDVVGKPTAVYRRPG